MRKTSSNPTWGKAAAWTAIVATITCTAFIAVIAIAIKVSGYLDRESDADKISRQVTAQIAALSEEVRLLRSQNKETRKYLELWTPMKCRKELNVKEVWTLPGYGIPRIAPRSYIYIEQKSSAICAFEEQINDNDVNGAVNEVRDVQAPQEGQGSRKD
tara:strand:- start:111 stop:584 length:474 start_codon:yes stop_codon:yes gene_type:complete